MKPIPYILLLALLLLPSCLVYKGADGTMLGAVGTNAQTLKAGGLSVDGLNQSEGIKEAGEAARNLARLGVQRALIGEGIKATQSIGNNAVNSFSQ
jgi:hypothetical protein